MRRNALLGHLVHLFGAYLNLEGVAVFGDDGGVQRLVEVGTRHGDEVLDAAGNRTPCVVNDAERGIAVIDRAGDDSQRQQVIHLIDVDLLPLQLLIDGVHPLDARIDARLNIVFLQLGG